MSWVVLGWMARVRVYKRIVLFVAILSVTGIVAGPSVVGLVTSPLVRADTAPGDSLYLVVSDRYDVGVAQAIALWVAAIPQGR